MNKYSFCYLSVALLAIAPALLASKAKDYDSERPSYSCRDDTRQRHRENTEAQIPAKRARRDGGVVMYDDEAWDHIIPCFARLNQARTLDAIINWCSCFKFRMWECDGGKLADPAVNNLSLARLITALGQKVAKNERLLPGLKAYFSQDPDFMAFWRRAALRRMHTFDEQGLANIIYAHGNLGQNMDAELYDEWQRAALRRMYIFNEQGLANIIYAHGKLRQNMDGELYDEWRIAALRIMPTFNEQHLANIIYAHGKLGQNMDGELYHEWRVAALGRMPTFNEQELANIIHALCLQHLMQPAIEKHSIETTLMEFVHWCERNEQIIFIQDELHSLFLARQYCLIVLQKPILNNLNTKFDQLMEKEDTSSQLQKDVAASLKQLELWQVIEKYWCPITKSYIDAVIELKNPIAGERYKILVQTDGPSHYRRTLDGDMVLSSATLLQNSILQAAEIPLLRIPYYEWNSAVNKSEYLLDKIHALFPELMIAASIFTI